MRFEGIEQEAKYAYRVLVNKFDVFIVLAEIMGS
jgi:hypothetical protein